MYIPNPGNIVQALDATTGDRLWQYTPEPEDRPDEGPDTAPSRGSRSIAIYGDKIYLNTTDAHIVALDARTGEVAWDHTVADHALGYRYSSGPIVVRGTIVAGMTGCQNYKNDVCFISGHDAETGEEPWRTSTVARPDTGGARNAGADRDGEVRGPDAAERESALWPSPRPSPRGRGRNRSALW